MSILNQIFLLLTLSWLSLSNLIINETILDELSLNQKINSQSILSLNTRYFNSTIKLKRNKRGVLQLSGMIKCMTGCKPLSYRGYGCFCGYMGSGEPIDDIDKCCKEHDYCYSHTSCAHFMVYILPYQWKCTESKEAKCKELSTKSTDNCAYQLCKCDKIFGECLSKYKCPEKRLSCTH